MNYTDIENITYNNGTEDEETVICWRKRRGKTQLLCPKCDRFFDVPEDITINKDGYFSDSIYHFCDDIYEDEENNDGWCILAHIVGWE